MNKPIAAALLVVGIVLLFFGFQASDSAASAISETFTGTPTDKSMWLIVAGALTSVIGVIGLARASRV